MDTFNLPSAIKALGLEASNAEIKKTCNHVADSIENKRIELPEAVKILSELLLNFEDAHLFRKYLSSVILALVTLRIPLKPVFSTEDFQIASDTEKFNHLEYSIVLALLADHPDIVQYALKYFEINAVPPFEIFFHHSEAYNVAPKKRRLHEYRQKISEKHVVACCHTLLKKLPNELSVTWDWTNFISGFSNHEDAEIRWMVKECIIILTNMTESQSKILSTNMALDKEDYSDKHIIPPVTNEQDEVRTAQLDGSVVNIDGILLPVYSEDNVQSNNLIPVKSTVNNLRSLALAVASGKAISLLGPVGSGKTCLVEHLAAITGRKGVAFKKVQLGDQTDARMLLGAHQCTDIPGEFIWRPGVLTEAVQNGHWLLLEDIDCATLDVASALSSLLERRALTVTGYKDMRVAMGFQLFVTQRTLTTNYGFQKKMSSSSNLLQKHLTQINVEPLSRSELAEIIQTRYPSLSTICSRMIEVFMMFSVGSHDTSLQSTQSLPTEDQSLNLIRGTRLISTRDLMKWCARVVVDFDVTSTESGLKVLQDALDIFTCSVSSPEDRLQLSKKIGTCLGIVETKSEFYCRHYKPNVSLTPSDLVVGRAKVERKEKSMDSIDFAERQAVFSFTRQSACLLERISCCVMSNEPVLLVGETGTGKTSSVQYLARQTGHKLVVINMNQQSDSADLLGGYKPVELKYVIKPIKDEFESLFKGFYNVEKNQKFLNHIDTCYRTESWSALVALMRQSHKSAVTRLTDARMETKLKKWLAFGSKLLKLEQQVKSALRLTFAFIEGSLVRAMQEGHWVLLDEINLASAEILECLAGLLEDKSESIELLEKGDKMPIKRHPDFTLFACMNPATDVDKKDLPAGLRNRFTEFFIDELTERNDLMLLIGDYLYHMNLSGAILEAIFNFYSGIRKEAKLTLVDGSGNAPHFSLRTLCRALTAAARARCGTVARSLYEAFCLSFLTQLDRRSHPVVEAMIAKAVIGKKNIKSVLNQLIPEPNVTGQKSLLFEGHWIPQGHLEISIPEGYILTPTVRKNLRDIARVVSLSRLPVLLQGDTSVGKTSLITYIAKASGNYCVRINNHEHTDLQEYIGSYASDANGKLVFKEGVLVEAMRKGYWIILDELNLAPSDVLEALNRVLDDNRELFIPETQQVIRADPNFMLFATQNPPGLYGGRKMLSRAFRNRFVELHFDEIPRNELEIILHQRCHIPPTYSKKMIAVMAELQVRRRGSAAVQGKDGFITLRDLFRWGQRYKFASKEMLTEDKFYDWDQHIADEGYLVLAGKVRQPEERSIIEEVIEKHIKRKVDPNNLFSFHQSTSPVTKPILELLLNNQLEEFSHVVWTFNMRRLAVLIAKSFTYNEPVLLVGETGCGKTTICQVLATLRKRQLFIVNCHMHTESSDFLGGLRPVRNYQNDGRLFEWVDGPLIKAMENGHMFLADEISLADDSVLERLNSLLEPERQLVLAERGMEDNSDIVVITAEKEFHFIGTMNPGGDYGKKELSPALRNRFTEIWCDTVTSRDDLLKVLEKSINKGISLGNQEDGTSGIGNSVLDFTDWLKSSDVSNKFPFSIRDLLSWVNFINSTVSKGLLDTPEAYIHGACMTFLDCFGTAVTGHIEPEILHLLRKNAISYLINQMEKTSNECSQTLIDTLSNAQTNFVAENTAERFGIKPFYIEVGSNDQRKSDNFTFTAPTTGSNTLRLLRGLQLNKAILLEGNPGVGKTSLVTALARASGHKVVRINLSDQTDITDLFGTDLPSEDGSFTFKEGAFLTALQNGDWILLDELNLAPQPVLEGLNACLDHRGEVFIPELGKVFKVKENTRLFACQNPLKQGGARRGLPISFLNRFTQVYIDTLTREDLRFIVESQYPSLSKDILHRIVSFNCKIAHEITILQSWAHKGGPWEMNLRDIQRWCDALSMDLSAGNAVAPGKYVDMLYVNRMRSPEDKQKMIDAYDEVFCPEYPRSDPTPQLHITESEMVIGDVVIQRNCEKTFKTRSNDSNLLVLRNQLPVLKALAQCVKMNWLSILVGPTSTGKSTIVQVLADLTGNELQVVPVTSAMDVSDLLGGFEQVDYNRNLENIFESIETITIQTVRTIYLTQKLHNWKSTLLNQLQSYKNNNVIFSNDVTAKQIEKFIEKIRFLLSHCEKLIEYNKSNEATSNKIRINMQKLRALESKVGKSSSVNVGGKFEWIDSLLVKTMLSGSWLLLDNVNLTSSAILDRLNGLLEPNGVLSIPERGEVCDLTPHPNFRVFFTVDPKFGEISRAMRNRGVEMFILRPDSMDVPLSETMPYLDLVALISSCGLPKAYHRICIACHELMTSFVQGLEKPSISQLIQAAHLIWQQIVRGIPYNTAFVTSFSDVYIKPRCGGDFASGSNVALAEMKNSMLSALQELIEKENIDVSEPETNHTLTVDGLNHDSNFEISKQLSSIVTAQTTEDKLLSLCSVLVAYQKSSKENFTVLNRIIKQDATKLPREFNEIAYNTSMEIQNKCSSYKRYYPESYKIANDEVSISNSQTALFYVQLCKAIDSLESNSPTSALSYSEAVLSGKLFDDFADYPILKYCKAYMQKIDEILVNAIRFLEQSLNDEQACRIIQLISWRNRFLKLCSISMFVQTKKKKLILNEDILPLLYMHNKWLQKNLLNELFKLLPKTNPLSIQFNETFKDILLETDQDNTVIMKLAKKLRKSYGQPKLYDNEEHYKLSMEIASIYKDLELDLTQPLHRQSLALCIDTTPILNANNLNGETVATMRDYISKTTECLNKIKPSDTKLLPITSYIIQRVLTLLQNHFITVISTVQNGNHVTNVVPSQQLSDLIATAKAVRGFPSSFLHMLQMVQIIEMGHLDDDLRSTAIPVKFWTEYYKHTTHAPCHYPLAFIAEHGGAGAQSDMDIPVNTRRASTNLPLLPYYVQMVTVREGDGSRHSMAYEAVSLRDRKVYSKQLDSLLNVIWKNIGLLETSAAYKLNSDALFEVKKFEQLVTYLHAIISAESNFSIEGTILRLQEIFKGQNNSLPQILNDAHRLYNVLRNSANKQNVDKIGLKLSVAQLSLLTSLIFTKVMSEINPVDHIEKYRLKVDYIHEDVRIFDALLSTYYMTGLTTGSVNSCEKYESVSDVDIASYAEGNPNRESLKKVHPYCDILLSMKQKTLERVNKYASGNTFRPKETPYTNFVKDCRHFTKSVLSSTEEFFRKLVVNSQTLLEAHQSGKQSKDLSRTVRTCLDETTSWLYSVNSFYQRIEASYSDAFQDLAKPLLSSLAQITYSVTSLRDLMRELMAKLRHASSMNKITQDLMVFPNVMPKVEDKERWLNRFVKEELGQLLANGIVAASGDESFGAEVEYFEMLKMNLTELKMYSYAMERVDKPTFGAVASTLGILVQAWERQQRDIERRKLDDDALYVTKSKCEDEDEDAQAQEEITEMFPSFSDRDFAEFKQNSLEQKKVERTDKPKARHLINQEDITLVYTWHSNYIKNLTMAEWLPVQKKLVAFDAVSALMQRYPIFSRVIQEGWDALDVDIEGEISPTLLVLISQIKDKVDGYDTTSQKLDFYHSPWVTETTQCAPLLDRVRESTQALLDQWPDFPTLKDIISIVDRIESFPVTSPVTRFLTGLELLRDKIEEWNKNAHRGNNMIEVSLAVGQQIINWRKLEMSHWKECLNSLFARKQAEAHKYWFFVYSVIKQYLQIAEDASHPWSMPISSEVVSADRVIGVLKDFMEKSNLAEFEVRLDIVYVYHCHLVHYEPSARRDELISILWNTHNYYAQFAAVVANRIKEGRAPIEKKLRDFVKICSWDRDLSYWSVKDTVEKAHKALHKHTKEFEKLLLEPATSCLVDSSSDQDRVGLWDRPRRGPGAAAGGAYLVDAQNYLAVGRVVKKYLDAEEASPLIQANSLLAKVGGLFNKARNLCKDTMAHAAYPTAVQALDDFVTTVVDTSTHLGGLEVDATLPKEKQTSQAKNILQLKRKSLADLFRYLSKMGLNYRTGLVLLSTEACLYDFTVPPVDVDAAMSYLKNRRCDTSLSLLWSGCERYFQKNIARHRRLTAALHSPHADLGVQNIDRCKGFSAQLLKMTNSQKKSISKYTRRLCELRSLTTNLTTLLDIESDANIITLKDKIELLTETYGNMIISLEQFYIVLKSCPEISMRPDSEPNFDSTLSGSPLVNCFKNTTEWSKLADRVKNITSIVNKQKTALHKVRISMPKVIGNNKFVPFASQNHIDITNEAKDNLEIIEAEIRNILEEYQLRWKADYAVAVQHPVLRSISIISNNIKDAVNKLKELDAPLDVSMDETPKSASDIVNQTEDIIATMLLIIQSIYKKHLPHDKSLENADVIKAIDDIISDKPKQNESESKEILEDDHLKELLEEKLTIDTKMLQLDALNGKIYDLLVNYVQYAATQNADELKPVVQRVVPIMAQMVLFVQYFVTQKVAVHRVTCKMLSILLKIFADLSSKGFCKPSDLDTEEGEGEGGQLSSGTGLGEGEGQKDVSEKIENQDQLDDARRPGDEKKEEDKDCKEEEKGVNMTDDFDSHLQDVEKGEDDEDQDKDDEDDADKQMGDIDNAAEKLDQQIWGSDDEEEPEEQEKNEKEDKGTGESTGEKEMAAKDEEQGQDDGNEGKEKKKKKKEINEMQEPEVDDDHIDPYHGNQQLPPEPEDFDLPENMELDGEQKDEDDGETETENPFDLDVMKDKMAEEPPEEERERNDAGLDVSSDEGEDDDKAENGEDKGDAEEKADIDNTKEPETEADKGDEADKGEEAGAEPEPEEAAENAEIDETQPETEEPKPEENAEKDVHNPDNITEEDKPEERKDPNPEANPSNNDPSTEEQAEKAETETGTQDNVEVNPDQNKCNDSQMQEERTEQQSASDRQAAGQSAVEQSAQGHRGRSQPRAAPRAGDRARPQPAPGRTREERTLGEVNEKRHQPAKTLNPDQDTGDQDSADQDKEQEADEYQHVTRARDDDVQAVDAATREQAEQQPTIQKEEEEDAQKLKEDEEVVMDQEDDLQMEKSEELAPEKLPARSEKERDRSGRRREGDDATGETGMEVEGDAVATASAARGNDSSYHTRHDIQPSQADELSLSAYLSHRAALGAAGGGGGAAAGPWRALWRSTAAAARALTERLRLTLEPTARSRRAGDFRTGRAINMRRVVAYVASQFRRDRIWLRRTRPAKREYRIALAVDDSSSMRDNRSQAIAFESLALVSQALNLLEAGELAVVSFGEQPRLLHSFAEQFSEHSGADVIEHLRFEQTKTRVAQLLDFCTVMFEQRPASSDAVNARLLVIVSDGRGIFSEGEARVTQAVRRARQLGVFLVYVIIDNPDNKDSIMDIRRPLFDASGALSGFTPYLDAFPFPYYLILRDVASLPAVLADALRQWFELAANSTC